MHYMQVSMGGYSSISYVFQVDVEARTSNTAVLFAGVYLTVGSLRDPFRKSISTTIPKLLSYFRRALSSQSPIPRSEPANG